MDTLTGLRRYMGTERREKLLKEPTYHSNCKALFGVARPGKTRRDRAKRP